MQNLLKQTDRLFFEKTNLSLSSAQNLTNEALLGSDDGELFLEYNQSESFLWDDGKLKNSSFDTTKGFGLRRVVDEAIGFALSVNLDEKSLKDAKETVKAVSGHSVKVSSDNNINPKSLYANDNPLLGKKFEEKILLLQEIDSYIRNKSDLVKQVSVSLSGNWKAVQIIKQDEFRIADIRPMVRLNISVAVQKGDRMEGGGTGFGGRESYDRIFDEKGWKHYADEALRKALVNLEAKEAPSGEMTVVLGSGWSAVLLHEAIGHGLEGDFNRKKSSVFSGLMGEQIASKGVTIIDDGTIEGRRGSINIDDEGTETQRTVLIEDGKLVGYMYDRMNARLMGTKSTGNGRRESFAYPPYPRMTNTFMNGGNHSKDEIIASVKKGIYAPDFGGGQVDITSGKFVFSASEAYEIENGKIGSPIKGASLVGSGIETLTKISMIGNDMRLDSGVGTCGKSRQSVPCGVGQPTLRLENMTVGGNG